MTSYVTAINQAGAIIAVEPKLKPCQINIRATEADKDRWTAAAKAERRTLSSFIAVACDDRIKYLTIRKGSK